MLGSIKVSREDRISTIGFCISWVVSIALVISAVLATKLLPHEVRQHLFLATADWIFDFLKLDKFAKIGKNVGYDNAANAIKNWIEYSLGFVISVLAALWISRKTFVKIKAEEIFEAFFAEPGSSFLTPIQKPKAFDPLRGVFGENKYQMSPLKWIPGNNTSRAAAFEKILKFAQKKDGKVLRGKQTYVPFKMLLIVGPLSSGKSRLAMEAARNLARRDIWGGDSADKKKLAIAAIGLRSLWSRFYRDDDPWDAWWLAGPSSFDDEEEQDDDAETGPYTSWEHRKQMREDPWLEKLRAWRPRRPTIFLLDDPLPGDANAVANALHVNEAHYRHPVRLMIVSPMPPDQLEGKNTAIRKDKTIILSADDSFTEGDIRVAGSILGNDRNPLWRNEAVTHLHSITKGNPLLVEIALDILRRGRDEGRILSVTDLTRERLLTDRVERWREALKSKGVSEKQEHALAAATLAAGAKQGQLRRFLGKDASIDKDVIRQLFLGAKAENKGFEIPPLRPIMIGDAFVRNVIEEHCDKERHGTRLSEADKVLAAAWNANPLGMIASIERLSAVDDLLGQLITQDPITDLKVSKKGNGFDAEIARAWGLTAMRVPRSEWDAGNKTGQPRTMMVALGIIDKLSPKDAASSLQDFVGSIPTSNESWIVRSRDASRLIEAWVEKALLDGPSWQGAKAFEKVFALDRSRWRLIDIWGLTGWTSPVSDTKDLETKEVGLRNAYQRAVNTLPSQKEAQQFLLQVSEFADDIDAIRAPFHAAATLHGLTLLAEKAGDKILAERLWIQANACGLNRDACRLAIADFEQMTAAFPGDERVQLERAKAFQYLAQVHSIFYDIEETKTASANVTDIADKYSGKQDFELARAQAISSEVYCICKRRSPIFSDAIVETLISKLEYLHKLFFVDHRFAFALVKGLRFWAFYKLTVDAVDAVNSIVCKIGEVSAPFSGLPNPIARRIVANLVDAQMYLVSAYANINSEERCFEALQRLEEIAKPSAGSCRIEDSRADAWRFYCGLDSLDKANAQKAYYVVESIVAPFLGDISFELQRVQAGTALAWRLKDDQQACKSIVSRVAKIADAFKGNLGFEQARAEAYAALSWGTGDDLASAREACGEIERVAAQFPSSPSILLSLATALCWGVAFAAQRADELDACRAAAIKLDGIADRYPTDGEILWRQAEGWKYLAFAVRADASQYDEALNKLRRIAIQANNDQRCLDSLAQAERYSGGIVPAGPAIRIGTTMVSFNFTGTHSFNRPDTPKDRMH
jgi:hypothetical protein